MQIFVLISTIDRRILRVPTVLREPEPEVHYVVVWQQTRVDEGEDTAALITKLNKREDVTVVTLPGRGLSRSRNAGIKTAVSLLKDPLDDAVCIISDDDESFSDDAFGLVNSYYIQHPDVDIALMRMRSNTSHRYFKKYPDKEIDYRKRPRSYYVASWEMTFRTRVWQAGVHFDERFGLGAHKLCAGEEDIFMIDAMDRGLKARIVPIDMGVTWCRVRLPMVATIGIPAFVVRVHLTGYPPAQARDSHLPKDMVRGEVYTKLTRFLKFKV